MFNDYIWTLYKESETGKQEIEYYSNITFDQYSKDVDTYTYEREVPTELQNQFTKKILKFSVIRSLIDRISEIKVDSITKALKLLDEIVENGIPLKAKNKNSELITIGYFGGKGQEIEWYGYIDLLSLGLFFSHPDYYLPYFYNSMAYQHMEGFQFYNFEEICLYFKIPIPKVPGKQDKLNKAKYYGKINQALFEFRMLNGLSSGEMCAFLYDFALNITQRNNEEELPKPTKAWLLKSKIDFEFLDNLSDESVSRWDGNPDIRRGDILLIYCMSPRKYIHSIWRALSDGFVDPFFHYHNTVVIGGALKTEPVKFKELDKDPILSQMGAVRARMQGAGGVALSSKEYNAILEIMRRKGQNVSLLPTLEIATYPEDMRVENEKDVEKSLVEPFLNRLEYSQDDWIRQMPIKMGRGERYYPDYAIGANPKRGEETAKLILEAKYSISSNKDLLDAFYQAKSYALRLMSKSFVLASKEGVWIYPLNKGNYFYDNFIHRNWKELTEPDVFHDVLMKIGKKKIK